ncbi:MAG: 30S ribosomal protein S16 [bacterium]
MVKLRLAKQGRKKLPIFKIVAADERARRDGRFIEALGQYRPKQETGKVELNEDRIMYWLNVGAQPTDTLRSILSKEGILLKWHLEKKKVEPARAAEIFATWKAQKEATLNNKLVSKKENDRKKKAELEAAKAAAAAAKAKAEEPVVEEVVEAPVMEAAPEVAPEAPAETAAAE